MPKILLVEDNKDILYANKVMLEFEGYDIITAMTVESAKKLAVSEMPDLLILDIMLPDGNGIDLCKELKKVRDFNVIFLSALDTKKDILDGLKAGGYDYVTKPYIMEELLLRVKNLLKIKSLNDGVFTFGSVKFKSHALVAEYKGEELLLKPKEYMVLDLLCRNQGMYLSAEYLM